MEGDEGLVKFLFQCLEIYKITKKDILIRLNDRLIEIEGSLKTLMKFLNT